LVDFDYNALAELYLLKSRKGGPGTVSYRRFDAAAEALRFAVEELSPRSIGELS
jgi:hypothetical protein